MPTSYLTYYWPDAFGSSSKSCKHSKIVSSFRCPEQFLRSATNFFLTLFLIDQELQIATLRQQFLPKNVLLHHPTISFNKLINMINAGSTLSPIFQVYVAILMHQNNYLWINITSFIDQSHTIPTSFKSQECYVRVDGLITKNHFYRGLQAFIQDKVLCLFFRNSYSIYKTTSWKSIYFAS